MGNLQSLLSDCQVGEMPVYLKNILMKEAEGDEAYMVYVDRNEYRSPAPEEMEEDNIHYSGPSQKHVRTRLIQEQQRKNVADLVNLCVGDQNEANVEAVAGGGVFILPKRDKVLNSETWDEAEQEAREKGSVKASPGMVCRVDERTPESIPDPGDSEDSEAKHSIDEEDSSSSSDSDESEHPLKQPNVNESSSHIMESKCETEFTEKDLRRMMIQREEESKLAEHLNILVHPLEESDVPIEIWYLLDAHWFRVWKSFLAGGPRPGKITNNRIINIESDDPWPGLKPGTNYVGLDYSAWKILCDLYGADIVVERPSFDIYS